MDAGRRTPGLDTRSEPGRWPAVALTVAQLVSERSLDPPDAVRAIVARLERAGFETWCVGGAVRDALLGEANLDWDLATAATPTEVMRLFRRTVPVGVKFGTVGVVDEVGTMHEVTTFRRDVTTDGRHAVVQFGKSLDEDLARRDFTINAIAFHPQRGEIRDPYEGRLDLRRGVVRAVGLGADRMREDRLRALRAIRFAARFGFHIEPATWDAIRTSASHLALLSAERVKQELEKTMAQVERPSVALAWWRESGALAALVPELADAPVERFEATDYLPRPGARDDSGAKLNRLAMLFFGEREAVASTAVSALRFSNSDARWISRLAGASTRLLSQMDEELLTAEPQLGTIRRWVAEIGRTQTATFFALYNALWHARLARAPNDAVEARLAPLASLAETIAFRDPIEASDLAVDGEDLRRSGIPSGPVMGRIIRALVDRVVQEPVENTRERLLSLARSMVSDASS